MIEQLLGSLQAYEEKQKKQGVVEQVLKLQLNFKEKEEDFGNGRGLEAVVAEQEVVDEGEKEEEASTTTTKVKIEEKAQQDVMEEVARGQGMTSPKSSATTVKDLAIMLLNVELQIAKLKRRRIMRRIRVMKMALCWHTKIMLEAKRMHGSQTRVQAITCAEKTCSWSLKNR